MPVCGRRATSRFKILSSAAAGGAGDDGEPIGGARKSARPSSTLGHPCLPVVTRSERLARRLRPYRPTRRPPPSLKASGELQEKVPRVYTHMRRTIFSESRRARGQAGVASDYVEATPARPVCVSAYTQSLPTYICIVTLYGNNVCDHSARRPAATSFNRSPRRLF